MPNGLIDCIKRISINAVDSTRPMQFVFGRVHSLEPLSVSVEQKITLGLEFLVLSNTVFNLLVNDQILIGDTMLMIQVQGGQKFIVLDKGAL